MSDLTLPPLDEQCGACETSGQVTNLAFAEWEQQYDAAEKEWRAANPEASWWRWTQSYEQHRLQEDAPPEMRDCPTCYGTGYIPTEAGRAVLEFLNRHPGRR